MQQGVCCFSYDPQSRVSTIRGHLFVSHFSFFFFLFFWIGQTHTHRHESLFLLPSIYTQPHSLTFCTLTFTNTHRHSLVFQFSHAHTTLMHTLILPFTLTLKFINN